MPLRIDVPLSQVPPIEQCVCGVFVFDRTRSAALKALREVLGDVAAERVLQAQGRWLFLAIGRGGAFVMAVDTEREVIEAHRGLLHIPGAAGHVEVFTYIDAGLRRRVVDDSQRHALLAMPGWGVA